ncbi:FAD-dependent oxidoreductase [Mycobacterium kubicae]|uniref:FAD-dependent oxidoreductase n=1 Tax=Mycobacterium kubicae TaxID=120959 RepID=UPI000800A513|nr:FAD-dependent oxidoreductase [Mycobacterium kubicae]OBK49065.1 potassium transporter [Mycobacterium kubicae]
MTAVERSDVTTNDVGVARCDVCIVGAGAAGLNALFAASQYLSRDQKIILIERRERVGGMWVDTYPYVRLHQPHGMFTAGNIKWTLTRDRSYLASKGEVLYHLEHCLDVIKRRVTVEEYYGWHLESYVEAEGIIRVSCNSADGKRQVFEAKRLIKAFGFAIMPNPPLDTSSLHVRSVSPDFCDVRGDDVRASKTPVWIIGGGKTAMDTAHTLLTECPGREVNLVAGGGTFFHRREKFFPVGLRQWWGGQLTSSVAVQLARHFDGTNEAAVWKWHREKYGTWLTPETGNFLLAWLSESENKTIAAGLTEVVMDHFVDVVDRGGVTELLFRSGARKPIPQGSWIVNCTGYLTEHSQPYEPYVSASGAVVSVQLRSATMHLTTAMGYFLTHLMFLDKLREIPLYELDAYDLRTKSKKAYPYALLSLANYNLGYIVDSVPSKVFRDCGIDFDRWYPLPRRLFGAARFMLMHRRERERLRRTLDTVRERFDTRCGPLPHGVLR